MLPYKWLRLLCGLCALSGAIYGQCYDLTSAQLYEVKGRFQERWDRPIWDAKPGEGNFHLDEQDWMGGIDEFIIFSIGQVQQTGAGWVPRRESVVPESWCDWTPQRSGVLCYHPPFQTPSANAIRVPPQEHSANTWTLTRDGFLRFSIARGGDRPLTNTDPRTDAIVRYLNQGRDLGSTFEAVLDLNTGAYSAVSHSHFMGYFRRFPAGAEVLRDTVLSAKVKLSPQPCLVSVRKASLGSGREIQEEARPVPICVVREKKIESQHSIEFILNPQNATSAQGCVVAHEGPMPSQGLRLAQAPAAR